MHASLLSNLMQDIEDSCSDLRDSSENNLRRRRSKGIDFIVSCGISQEFHTSFEGHFQEWTDTLVHPNSIHSLHFTGECQVVRNKVQVTIVNDDTVHSEDCHDFFYDRISCSFNLQSHYMKSNYSK